MNKKTSKNKIIDQIIDETISEYMQESSKVIAEQICSTCPLKNEQCKFGPCKSAVNMIVEYTNNQITYMAMLN